MVDLLQLPVEIRHQIIDKVLQAEVLPPQDYTLEEERRRKTRYYRLLYLFDMYSFRETREYTYNETIDGRQCNSLALLLTCRKLRSETMHRLGGKAHKVDVLLVGGSRVWPTWTCLPSRVRAEKPLDCLQITIRVAEKRRDLDLVPSTIDCNGGEGPCSTVWTFFELLETFGLYGSMPPPPFYGDPHRFDPEDRKVRYFTSILDIDVVEPYTTEPNMDLQMGHFPKDSPYVDKLFDFLTSWMTTLLRMPYFLGLPQVGIMFEMVGILRMRKRGILKLEVNLGDLLCMFPSRWDHQDLVPWLQSTTALRKHFGLGVVERERPREDTESLNVRLHKLLTSEWNKAKTTNEGGVME